MTTFGRRTFLGGAAVLTATATGGWWSPAASAGAAAGPHEELVRDAAPVWSGLPSAPESGALLGNGSTVVRVFGDGPAIRFGDLARLDFAGAPTASTWRLDLWNAELTGVVTTTRGSVEVTALVHRHSGALVVGAVSRGGEDAAVWTAAGARRPVGAHQVFFARGPAGDPDQLAASHREWWNSFHGNSFASLPDRELQRFHVVGLYEAAAVVGPGTAFAAVPPAVVGANRQALLDGVDVSASASPGPVPGSGSKGGAAANPLAPLPALWSLHEHLGRPPDALVPALRKAVAFYAEFLVPGADGRLHLPTTLSPGYADVVDCAYDLALLRWALRVLPAEPRWADVAARLVPPPTGATGLLVGAGVPLTRSHPHPWHLADLLHDNGVPLDTARRSVAHWAGLREHWTPSSHAVAATLAARVRDAGAAVGHLREALPSGPPANQAVLDLLVRGRSGSVDVFPAVPEDWRDASVESLRVPGAFLVDASRRRGRTEWVRVRGAAGGELVVRHDVPDARVTDERGRPVPSSTVDGGVRITVPSSGSVVLSGRGSAPDLAPRVVSGAAAV